MKRPILAFTATAVAALAMAGCSSSTVGTSPPKVITTAPSAPSTTTTTTAPLATAQSLLLTVDQMPSGWSVNNTVTPHSANCYADPLLKVPQITYGTVAFVQGGTAPELVEDIGSYDSPAAAFASIKSTMDGCTSFTETANTLSVTGSMGAMSAPTYGDQSTAYTATLNEAADGITLEQGIVIARKGAYIVALALGDLGSVDTDQLKEFMTTALAKVP